MGGFEGSPPDAIHRAPRSIGVNSETTHIGWEKFSLRRLPDMIFNRWIKLGLIVQWSKWSLVTRFNGGAQRDLTTVGSILMRVYGGLRALGVISLSEVNF